MPRIEADELPQSARSPQVLGHELTERGFEKRTWHVQIYTKDGEDVIVASQPGEHGNLETQQVTYPSSLNQVVGPLLAGPFSTSDRMPGEDGV
jgi:hypothetical protein